MHTEVQAHALAVGAKFNPEQGLGQIELPDIFESHIQAAKQGPPPEWLPIRYNCGSTE